ncbi:MAG: MBL fold metallo-hydrolase [Firmicutes bacterium]|nr:MBL fold metallo-hydrolase [Bacillota bacterium]
MSIKIYVFPKGPLTENTYLVVDEASGDKAVIDPGYFGSDIAELIGDKESLKYILLTHAHGDHIFALQDYKDEYPDAEVTVGADDKMHLITDSLNGSTQMGKKVECTANILVQDGDKLVLGESEISCIHTPGHTPGGVCYLFDKTMFSGDTLFFASVGATHFPGGSWEDLQKSIKEKLYTLPDDVKVHPGHGQPTSIGFERSNNPYV